MKKFLAAAAILAAVPAIASAQETAPDGTDAFGVEPYVGVLGGYHTFDRGSELGAIPGETIMNGALISGIAGVNVPLGPVFVGVEGNATKGFSDIDWEYGAAGRVGVGDPRSRWGSCASSGAIRYSWRLILAPPDVRRATVAHELAHLLHMDHSAAFHAAHARILGADPRPARAWLRANGAGLHRYRA